MEDTLEFIDVLISSASRPECMKEAMMSFLKHIKCSYTLRWVLHEDVVLKNESEEVLSWAKYNRIFSKIIITEPAQRLTHAVMMLLQEAKSKYILKLEDDWIFIDNVDIDYMSEVMDKNNDINQVYFNKSMTPGKIIFKNKMPVIAPEGKGPYEWAMAPGLWRMDFIKPRWREDISAYAVKLDQPVGDYLYGKDLVRPNIRHIGKVSTSKLPIDNDIINR
jgi:hypothetical protein